MGNYDKDGLINIATGMIDLARKDYIKGAKLYVKMHNGFVFPTLKDLNAMIWPQGKKKWHLTTNERDVLLNCYDAMWFFDDDPYELFKGHIKYDTIISDLNDEVILLIHKDYYSDGALYLRNSGIEVPRDISDDEAEKIFKDEKMCNKFLEARKYVKDQNKSEVLEEWDKLVHERYMKALRDKKKNAKNTASIIGGD